MLVGYNLLYLTAIWLIFQHPREDTSRSAMDPSVNITPQPGESSESDARGDFNNTSYKYRELSVIKVVYIKTSCRLIVMGTHRYILFTNRAQHVCATKLPYFRGLQLCAAERAKPRPSSYRWPLSSINYVRNQQTQQMSRQKPSPYVRCFLLKCKNTQIMPKMC